MGLVQDILDRQTQLASDRLPWESEWDAVIRFALPYEKGVTGMNRLGSAESVLTQGPRSKRPGTKLLDGTAIYSIERLAAGILSLTMPQSSKWHGLGSVDPLAPDLDEAAEDWCSRVTDYLFAVRYTPKAGFASVNEMAVKAACGLGTGVIFLEESFGDAHTREAQMPFKYSYAPLAECFLGQNAQGIHDTNYRLVNYKARQAVQKFGEKHVSSKLLDAANDPRHKDTPFQFIHAAMPRAEAGSSASSNRDSAFASYWVEVSEKKLVKESGYFTFPYVVHRWVRRADSPYGESPVMLAMREIVRAQIIEEDVARGVSQQGRPPIATVAGKVNGKQAPLRAPNFAPGANNKGYLDPSGMLFAKPFLESNGQALSFMLSIQEAKRRQIQDMHYINLFQILVDNSQMTATEVLQRAQEKGDLLGPVGTSFQQSSSLQVDRELEILERKEAFNPGSALEAPDSIYDHDIRASSTSPMDRLRRTEELIGANDVVDTALKFAQAGKTKLLERINEDEVGDLVADVRGASRKIFYSEEEMEAQRQQKEQMAQMQQMQAGLEMAGQAADVANKGVPAVEQLNALMEQSQ
nr:portal protein [uncultured Cohaesibacter sp.]